MSQLRVLLDVIFEIWEVIFQIWVINVCILGGVIFSTSESQGCDKHCPNLQLWFLEGDKQMLNWLFSDICLPIFVLLIWLFAHGEQCQYLQSRLFKGIVLMLHRLHADDWIWISILLDSRATARTGWEEWSVRLVLGGKPTTSSQVRFCQLSIMIELCSYILISKGSVLSVWTLVESVLTNDGQKKGQHAKMQVGWEV